MQNICYRCGGGIDSGYTAPEARCTCEPRKMNIAERKHDMLLAESRWLIACGWKPTDIRDKKQGFLWENEKGEGPFTQAKCVEIQKAFDELPKLQRQFDMEVSYMKIQKGRSQASSIVGDAIKKLMKPDGETVSPPTV